MNSEMALHYFTQRLVQSSRVIFSTNQLRVITSSFDWSTGLSPSFLIGKSHSFGFGFTTLH